MHIKLLGGAFDTNVAYLGAGAPSSRIILPTSGATCWQVFRSGRWVPFSQLLQWVSPALQPADYICIDSLRIYSPRRGCAALPSNIM
jgi:hypothetical protein